MKNQIQQLWEGFSNLFYPNLCLACNYNAPSAGEIFCLNCIIKLPKTKHHLEKENEFTRRLWGRVELNAGGALFLYSKKGRAQRLIYNLKYKGKKEVGVEVGKMYGFKLRNAPLFQNLDVIVPVPLHWKKERMRGYNQSTEFGKGLAEVLSIPLLVNALKRNIHSDSQTRKSR